MTKQEFDEKYVGCTTRVHCPTKELNDEFIDLARSFGYTRSDKWKDYEHNICYNVVDNLCGAIEYYVRCDYNIVEFKSLKEESMKDLRDLLEIGRVVETRDGCMGFVLEGKIIYDDGWDNLDIFRNDLTCENTKDGDIIKIYDCPIIDRRSWNFANNDKSLLNLVWERKEFEVSEDEKIILKNIDKVYNYITRDSNGFLFLYSTKPEKGRIFNVWCAEDTIIGGFSAYTHLFQFIKWEDEEPTLIKDLLK